MESNDVQKKGTSQLVGTYVKRSLYYKEGRIGENGKLVKSVVRFDLLAGSQKTQAVLFGPAADKFVNASFEDGQLLSLVGQLKIDNGNSKFFTYKFSEKSNEQVSVVPENVLVNPVVNLMKLPDGTYGVPSDPSLLVPENSFVEGVKSSVTDQPLDIKSVQLDSMRDDMGQFGEVFASLLGTASLAVGKYISVKVTDMINGNSVCTQIKLKDFTDSSLVGYDHRGLLKEFQVSEPKLLEKQNPYYLPDTKHPLLVGPGGEPLQKKITGIEILQPEIGQKFYNQAFFYTPNNGFYGLSKEELKPLLASLLRGSLIYGNFLTIVKGEKVPFIGAIGLDYDNSNGGQRTVMYESNSSLEYKPVHLQKIGGINLPLLITKETFHMMKTDPKGVRVAFGVIKKNGSGSVLGIEAVNTRGEVITLTGRTGVGTLRIDSRLNSIVFSPVHKQGLHQKTDLKQRDIQVKKVETKKVRPKMRLS